MSDMVREADVMADMYALVQELGRLRDAVRERARAVGYAIGTHGSMTRDIDLIAVPWTDEAVPADVLAEEVRLAVESVCGFAAASADVAAELPRQKPHGRLCWVWTTRLGGWWTYIDLSVMPLGGEK